MSEHTQTLPAAVPHTPFEDAQGLLIGPLFVALAVLMFREASLLTGGTTGLAFLLHYQTTWPLGAVLFAINLLGIWQYLLSPKNRRKMEVIKEAVQDFEEQEARA